MGPPLAVALAGLAAILILLLLPLTGDNDSSTVPLPAELTSGDGTPRSFPSPLVYPAPETLTLARVVRVVNGDTLEVEMAGRRKTVSYYGVDTPEENQPCYEEAKAWNQAIVGDKVRLLPDARDRDRPDRLVRYVFTPDGQSLDAALVVVGAGIAWRRDGALRDEIVALEQTARDVGIGCLWEGLSEGNGD